MTVKKAFICFALIAVLEPACAKPSFKGNGPSIDHGSDSEQLSKIYLQTAGALDRAGRYWEAAVYFEAALDSGEDELEILPQLIAAQVRAGMLVAAKQNLDRLSELAPDLSCVSELAGLLFFFSPNLQADRWE